jgi:hypothetical protein
LHRLKRFQNSNEVVGVIAADSIPIAVATKTKNLIRRQTVVDARLAFLVCAPGFVVRPKFGLNSGILKTLHRYHRREKHCLAWCEMANVAWSYSQRFKNIRMFRYKFFSQITCHCGDPLVSSRCSRIVEPKSCVKIEVGLRPEQMSKRTLAHTVVNRPGGIEVFQGLDVQRRSDMLRERKGRDVRTEYER